MDTVQQLLLIAIQKHYYGMWCVQINSTRYNSRWCRTIPQCLSIPPFCRSAQSFYLLGMNVSSRIYKAMCMINYNMIKASFFKFSFITIPAVCVNDWFLIYMIFNILYEVFCISIHPALFFHIMKRDSLISSLLGSPFLFSSFTAYLVINSEQASCM